MLTILTANEYYVFTYNADNSITIVNSFDLATQNQTVDIIKGQSTMQNSENTSLKLLADGLILFGMDKEDALLIIQMMYGKKEKAEKLMFWMTEHPKATPKEITNQALKIVRKKPQDR